MKIYEIYQRMSGICSRPFSPSPLFLLSPIIFLTIVAITPLGAWFYFTAGNGQRSQWAFGTSCNTNSRPIWIIPDADIPNSTSPGFFKDTIDQGGSSIIYQYNTPLGRPTINLFSGSLGSSVNMTFDDINAFLQSPASSAGKIWVVWDADGSILAAMGLDNSSLLGIGWELHGNAARPQDICAGVVILNGTIINSTTLFKKTLLHELGHTLGLAHSVAGGNGTTLGIQSNPSRWPVMYPFASSTSPSALQADDMAAIYAMYGPGP